MLFKRGLNIVRSGTKIIWHNCILQRTSIPRTLYLSIRNPIQNYSIICTRKSPLFSRKDITKQTKITVVNYTSANNQRTDGKEGKKKYSNEEIYFTAIMLLFFLPTGIGYLLNIPEVQLSSFYWKLERETIPMNEEDWMAEFNRYKLFGCPPIISKDTTLERFKEIFYVAYFNKQWLRLLFVGITAPALYLFVENRITTEMSTAIICMLFLLVLYNVFAYIQAGKDIDTIKLERLDVPPNA